MARAHNFNAGPAALPVEVLEEAQKELVNFNNTGMSVMELSHRSKDYEAVHNEAISLVKDLLNVPDDYEVLLIQGGASLQFSMIPMNFLTNGKTANYILTGAWSEKALKEAKALGETKIGAASKESNYTYIPDRNSIETSSDDAYVHITSNNTIFGTQYHDFDLNTSAPLFADMSSDILSKPIPVDRFSFIYAGAQKNLGPSGVTLVIVKKELLEQSKENIPTLLKYNTHVEKNSLYHTPPTFAIYMLNKVLHWIKDNGGAAGMQIRNKEKAELLYDVIDNSGGFYKGHAQEESRSYMNVTFNLKKEDLNQKFLMEAKQAGFVGLNGHRSVGGCRASIYNAVSVESCKALKDFMIDFQQKNQ
ncbi:3-phosphoserine/phosphohydroxythreonine transaminase [Alteribacillus bidgolensis]|uniref:Phosphoserine aminotransferase n=1 Tax=Alteribacillus bidgolensis TaxID=930129 RepID=A0A1G8N4C0_9BACI|nr:3-phosphoserine/phosphohydroxythreonine transaminase [Alteribacillus bidgolensis]SDI74897.1 phosphoserine aminotransferase apoenzyme [Alteribacillus bidgolensis]